MFVCWGRLSSYGRLVLRGGGNVSLRELKCPGLRSEPAPEGRAQSALSNTITVTGGLPVIGPAEIFTDLHIWNCKANCNTLCVAELAKVEQSDSRLLIVSQSDLSEVFPGVYLQLGGVDISRRGWRGRAGCHLASRHRRGPGLARGAGGLPARAEGDVARGVRHEGAGPAAGQEGQGAPAGRHVQPGRLRSPRGGTVDLVRDVTLIVTTLCELSGLSGHVNKVRNMIKLS